MTAGSAAAVWFIPEFVPRLEGNLRFLSQLFFMLVTIGSLCAAIGHWRGVRKGWSRAQAGDASAKLGCWVFGAVPAIAALFWLFGSMRDALSATPNWALVIIALLVAILFQLRRGRAPKL